MAFTQLEVEMMQRRLRKARGEDQEPPPPKPSNAVERELDLHSQIMQFCDSCWPPLPYIHADPTRRSRMTAGAPDFTIAIPGGKTLWIEAKDKDGKLSADQMIFKKKLEMTGSTMHVVRHIDEVKAIYAEAMK